MPENLNNPLCQLSIENKIAYVSLNRPQKLNALNMPLFYAIKKVIKLIKNDHSIRVVIIKAHGDDFCSGLDIKSVMQRPVNAFKLLWKWWPGNANLAQIVSVGWRQLKVPVVVCVHGRCWGGGLQIALGADFIYSTADASFSIMESRWGLIPDMGGTVSLREKVKLDNALALAMTADEFSAQQALEFGIVSKICNDPLKDASFFAEQLKQKSPDALASIKKLYHKAWHKNDGYILAAETWLQWKIFLGKNRKIAVEKQLGKTDEDYR